MTTTNSQWQKELIEALRCLEDDEVPGSKFMSYLAVNHCHHCLALIKLADDNYTPSCFLEFVLDSATRETEAVETKLAIIKTRFLDQNDPRWDEFGGAINHFYSWFWRHPQRLQTAIAQTIADALHQLLGTAIDNTGTRPHSPSDIKETHMKTLEEAQQATEKAATRLKRAMIGAACFLTVGGAMIGAGSYKVLSAAPVPATVQPQAAAFTLDSLKQAVHELDQQPARASDTVQAEIKNGGLRLYTDNKRTSAAVWSFNAYRLNASDQGVFDQGVRMPLSELKAQLTHATQANQANVELSSKDGQLTVTPTSARPDGTHSGNAIVRLADINGLMQALQGDDSRPVEFTFAAVSNDAVTFAIQGQKPAIATVYTVNYQED